MNMALYEFDYTKIYAADTAAESKDCVYTCRTTGNFAVIMSG